MAGRARRAEKAPAGGRGPFTWLAAGLDPVDEPADVVPLLDALETHRHDQPAVGVVERVGHRPRLVVLAGLPQPRGHVAEGVADHHPAVAGQLTALMNHPLHLGRTFARELRRRLFQASLGRASDGGHDNGPVAVRIALLRAERARLLGFDTHADLLKKLGKFTTSVGCLYIKKLDDVDKKVLKELVQASVKRMKQLSK